MISVLFCLFTLLDYSVKAATLFAAHNHRCCGKQIDKQLWVVFDDNIHEISRERKKNLPWLFVASGMWGSYFYGFNKHPSVCVDNCCCFEFPHSSEKNVFFLSRIYLIFRDWSFIQFNGIQADFRSISRISAKMFYQRKHMYMIRYEKPIKLSKSMWFRWHFTQNPIL